MASDETGGRRLPCTRSPRCSGALLFVSTDRIQAFGRAARPVDGRQVFYRRCSACHDNPGGRVPPREVLATRTQEDIVAALTSGALRELAAGLSFAEIEAVAHYLQ